MNRSLYAKILIIVALVLIVDACTRQSTTPNNDSGVNGQPSEVTVYVSTDRVFSEPILRAYEQKMQVRPGVVFLKVGQASDQLERACKELGVQPAAFEFRGDYYALPNVIPLLTQPSMLDLLTEIIEYPLPARRAAAE